MLKSVQVDWRQWFDFLRDTSKWHIGKRELIAGAIGAVVFGVLSWIGESALYNPFIIFPGPAIPAFFGIAFGPIAGLITGGLGIEVKIFLHEGHFVFDWFWSLGLGLMGFLPGLLYPLKNLRSQKSILQIAGMSILSFTLGRWLVEWMMRRFWGEWTLDIMGWLRYEFWIVVLVGAVILTVLLVAYDAIVQRWNQS